MSVGDPDLQKEILEQAIQESPELAEDLTRQTADTLRDHHNVKLLAQMAAVQSLKRNMKLDDEAAKRQDKLDQALIYGGEGMSDDIISNQENDEMDIMSTGDVQVGVSPESIQTLMDNQQQGYHDLIEKLARPSTQPVPPQQPDPKPDPKPDPPQSKLPAWMPVALTTAALIFGGAGLAAGLWSFFGSPDNPDNKPNTGNPDNPGAGSGQGGVTWGLELDGGETYYPDQPPTIQPVPTPR